MLTIEAIAAGIMLLWSKFAGVTNEIAMVLGLKSSSLFWSIAGGATAGFLEPGRWWMRLSTMIVGSVFAAAFGPLVARIGVGFLPDTVTLDDVLAPSGFVCGVIGMRIVAAAMAAALRLLQRAPDLVDKGLDRD